MALKRIDTSKVIESGCVVLGFEDSEFEVQVEDLTFIIAFVNKPNAPPIFTQREAPRKVRINFNNPNPLGGFVKFKAGTVAERELRLAMYWTSGEGNYLVAYTFSSEEVCQ
jgi:hypothetical protein